METFNPTRYFSLLIVSVCMLIMAGCASGPMSYMPQNQRVMLKAQQQQDKYNQKNDGKSSQISGKQGATRFSKTTRPMPGGIAADYYLTLNYTSKQLKLNLQQTQQLNDLMRRLPRPQRYITRIYAGPGIQRKSLKKVQLVEKRIQNLRKFLQSKVNRVDSYYEPNLKTGQINLQFIIPTDRG